MTAQPKPSLSEAEYLDYERGSPAKHEFWQGRVFAMVGASAAHNLIVANLVAALRAHVRGRGCLVFPSDMRLKVHKTGLYTYPDLSVVCGPPEFGQDDPRDTLLNPLVIVEVLSPSTEGYDRGLKFQNYRLIDSLREYVLVAQDAYRVEHYLREPDRRWVLCEAVGLEAVCHLVALQCALALNTIYENKDLLMPVRDSYHHAVRQALVKAGWIITHDPYTLTFGQRAVFVDLGAERLLAAEKDQEKIAVEIKTFAGASDIRDLENAVGQYVFYRSLLARFEPERKLYLAIPENVLVTTLDEPIARPVIEDLHIALIAFDPQKEVIVQWKR